MKLETWPQVAPRQRHLQDIDGAGGFEPPTSWVRSKVTFVATPSENAIFAGNFKSCCEGIEPQFSRQVCADMRRYDPSRELLARSSRNREGRFKLLRARRSPGRSAGRCVARPDRKIAGDPDVEGSRVLGRRICKRRRCSKPRLNPVRAETPARPGDRGPHPGQKMSSTYVPHIGTELLVESRGPE
jgi:hypothetical protein